MKLKLIEPNGQETIITMYDSKELAGNNSIKFGSKYLAYGESSSSKKTKLRIMKESTKYIILSAKEESISPSIPYTEKAFTTAGSISFIVPSGVTKLKVALCGGGGGGVVDDTYGYGESKAGSASSFESLSANGGSGAYASYGGWGDGYNAGTSIGKSLGQIGHALSFATDESGDYTGEYGAGGYGDSVKSGQRYGGYAGQFNVHFLTVTPGQTISGIVGKGGSGYAGIGMGKASSGNSGFILIAYGGDIK